MTFILPTGSFERGKQKCELEPALIFKTSFFPGTGQRVFHLLIKTEGGQKNFKY